jgi:hypothetical protein
VPIAEAGSSASCASAPVASVALAGVAVITALPGARLLARGALLLVLPSHAVSASTVAESLALREKSSSVRRRALLFTLASQSKTGSTSRRSARARGSLSWRNPSSRELNARGSQV